MPHSYDDFLEYIENEFEWNAYESWDDAFEELQGQYNESFIAMQEAELEDYYNNNT